MDLQRPKTASPAAFASICVSLCGVIPSAAHADTSPPIAPGAAAASCASAGFRQFDFWVGRWVVFKTGSHQRVGSSLIESLYDGCAIRENWSESGLTGGSLNSYDPADKRWRQTWVDASGARRDFVGGWQDNRMVLISTHPSARIPGAEARERMIFTVGQDGSVRQYSDASLDGGKTWVLRYDYTYRRADPAAVTPARVATKSACSAQERRQFDFWVGRWEVASAAKPNVKVADSLIENLYGGCAIRENWMPLSAAGGGSLSTFDPVTRAWRQTWVDSSGARVEFRGGWDGKAMVLTGIWPQPGNPTQITRMTYTVVHPDAVRQLGETSDDQGHTWQPSFDFIYRPAKPGPRPATAAKTSQK